MGGFERWTSATTTALGTVEARSQKKILSEIEMEETGNNRQSEMPMGKTETIGREYRSTHKNTRTPPVHTNFQEIVNNKIRVKCFSKLFFALGKWESPDTLKKTRTFFCLHFVLLPSSPVAQ